jgi:hypothetical protein
LSLPRCGCESGVYVKIEMPAAKAARCLRGSFARAEARAPPHKCGGSHGLAGRERAGHAVAWRGNSKTSRERHRERVPSSLPLAGPQDKLALRAVFSRRFRAGLIYAAPAALVPCLDLTCALDRTRAARKVVGAPEAAPFRAASGHCRQKKGDLGWSNIW